MAYRLEITNPSGDTIQTHIYADNEVRGALRVLHGIDERQIGFALDVINTSGSMFDLSIVEETDNDRKILWTARLSKYKGF